MRKTFAYLAYLMIFSCLTLSCQQELKERPFSVLTPELLKTPQGLQMALDAAYGGTRMFWGTQDLFTMTALGTDEFISGIDGNGDIVKYNSRYNPENGTVNNIWRSCYTHLNTVNGIIQMAPEVKGIAEDKRNLYIAEAKFLRANFYFILVQFWGDVTLNTRFQDQALTAAKRDPMSEVYKLIIQDLKDAIAVLPLGPRSVNVLPGKANAAAAMHVLAKVYLTRATSSVRQADDFQQAYTIAQDLIHRVAPSAGLQLLQDFKSVFEEGNESNTEVLWTVQHTANLPFNGPGNSSGADNVLNHMWVPRYEYEGGMTRDVAYGRPYIRCAPTQWLIQTAFRDKTLDTRFYKSFQTVWISNSPDNIPTWPNPLPPGAPAGAQSGAPKFKKGDTAIVIRNLTNPAYEINAAPYKLIDMANFSNAMCPAMTKYFDTRRLDMNMPSIRPVIVYRLAETYLIAAEALYKAGRVNDAVKYINAVRERAAYPNPNPQRMDITAGDLSIEFIMDERTRELCGEMMRWWDLVRTGTLLDRVRKYNADVKDNIVPKHLLRPIPQQQIDAVVTGPAYTQNPGW